MTKPATMAMISEADQFSLPLRQLLRDCVSSPKLLSNVPDAACDMNVLLYA
jgi:hypothetical protein